MNELTVSVKAKQGEISFNLDSLKESLSSEMEKYKNLVVTEDTVKESKKDLATLRKARKELNDRKIEVKKSFMEPYTRFEDEVKEALSIIDEPIAMIDAQVKEFEEKAKEEKKAHCRKVFDDTVGDLADYISFEKVFRAEWLNASFKDRDIIGEIEVKKIQVKNDLNAIRMLNSEIEDDLMNNYKAFGELPMVIQKHQFYMESKAKAEKRVEEERKAEEPKEEPKSGEVVFRVSEDDADKVRQFLQFSQIEFTEE